jgi:hypothetical protein
VQGGDDDDEAEGGWERKGEGGWSEEKTAREAQGGGTAALLSFSLVYFRFVWSGWLASFWLALWKFSPSQRVCRNMCRSKQIDEIS